MSIISHMGIDYDSPNIQIQDNPSATDLDNTKVPTGQTIKNYIDKKSFRVVNMQIVNLATTVTISAGGGSTASGTYTKKSLSNNLFVMCMSNSWVNPYGTATITAGSGNNVTIEFKVKNESANSQGASNYAAQAYVIEYVP